MLGLVLAIYVFFFLTWFNVFIWHFTKYFSIGIWMNIEPKFLCVVTSVSGYPITSEQYH